MQSTEKTILTGVPQGSILGPLHFILYTNDIKNCSKIVSILLFADDTSVLYSHFNFQILQETIQIEMNKIVDWLHEFKQTVYQYIKNQVNYI